MRQEHREISSAHPFERHLGTSSNASLPARGWTLEAYAQRSPEAQRPLEVLRLSLRASGWRGTLVIAPTARTMFTTAALRAARFPRS